MADTLFDVQLRIVGDRVDYVKSRLSSQFPNTSISVVRIERNPSRAKRFATAKDQISLAQSEFESLRDELQEWRDGLPENLSGSGKADELDTAISELETGISGLEEADVEVEFPGMMG